MRNWKSGQGMISLWNDIHLRWYENTRDGNGNVEECLLSITKSNGAIICDGYLWHHHVFVIRMMDNINID